MCESYLLDHLNFPVNVNDDKFKQAYFDKPVEVKSDTDRAYLGIRIITEDYPLGFVPKPIDVKGVMYSLIRWA